MPRHTGKHEAQTIEEQLSMMETEKEKGISVRRGQSIYRPENAQYKKEELQRLLTVELTQLADFATNKQISLSDLKTVQERTVIYLRCCIEAGTFPSSQGLARALGYTDRSLRIWRSKHGNDPTARWLEAFADLCAETLHQSALNGNAQPIISIFLSKALYDMKEENHLILHDGREYHDPAEYSEAEIRERLGLPMKGDKNQ